MPESFQSALFRWRFNFFPAYRGTGARVTYIAGDFREVRIRLPLNWRTRNLVGTTFGGSLYGAVDPIYMIMLIRLLGPDYVVWDKAATIRFKKPGRGALYARFCLDDQELAAIKAALTQAPAIDRTYQVDLMDAEGTVHAAVEKVIYIALRKTLEGENDDSNPSTARFHSPRPLLRDRQRHGRGTLHGGDHHRAAGWAGLGLPGSARRD